MLHLGLLVPMPHLNLCYPRKNGKLINEKTFEKCDRSKPKKTEPASKLILC